MIYEKYGKFFMEFAMFKHVISAFVLLLPLSVSAQMYDGAISAGAVKKNTAAAESAANLQEMKNNPVLQMSRSLIRNRGDQRKAYNLMVLQDVATYKLGDETLKKEADALKNNREYYRKLDYMRKKLSNSKMPDSKNREVMRILDDAGAKLVDLLGG